MKTITTIILIVFICFFPSSLMAQFLEKRNFNYKNANYDVFVLKIDSGLHNKIAFIENIGSLSEKDYFESIESKINTPFFAITASIVDSACNPLGFYINEANKINDINLNQGIGNFFLKPNGVFTVDSKSSCIIEDATKVNSNAPYLMAIQSGPMLLNDGSFNTQFDPTSKNKNIRCAVGTFNDKNGKFIVFIKSLVPISFYQMAEVFKDKFNCKNALNLESGANSSIHLPITKSTFNSKVSICRYLIITL